MTTMWVGKLTMSLALNAAWPVTTASVFYQVVGISWTLTNLFIFNWKRISEYYKWCYV